MFSKRETNILKGIAIQVIMVHHIFWGLYGADELHFLLKKISYFMVYNGFLFNHVFFAISGYGFALKAKKYSPSKIVLRNEISLWTQFWPVFILGWISFFIMKNMELLEQISFFDKLNSILITVYGQGGIKGILFWALDACGLNDAFGIPCLNPTWWYLSASQLALMAVAVIYGISKGRIGLAWISLILWAGHGSQTNLYISCMLSCLSGAVLAEYNVIGYFDKNKKSRLSGLACALVLLVVWYHAKSLFDLHYISSIFLPFSLFLLTHLILNGIPGLSTVLEFIGKNSAYLFMIHTFIYKILTPVSLFVYDSHWAIVVYMRVFIITLIIAIILTKLKEIVGYTKMTNQLKERIMMGE